MVEIEWVLNYKVEERQNDVKCKKVKRKVLNVEKLLYMVLGEFLV